MENVLTRLIAFLSATGLLIGLAGCDSADKTSSAAPKQPAGVVVPTRALPSSAGVLSIEALPERVKENEVLRLTLHAPVGTATGFVYWQRRVQGRWRTVGLTTALAGDDFGEPGWLPYPVPRDQAYATPGNPTTGSDPTFQLTRGPNRPGHYRGVKSLKPPGGENVWLAVEVDVV